MDVLTQDLAQDSIDRDIALYEQRTSKRARYEALKHYEAMHELHVTHRCSETQALLLDADASLLDATGQVR